MRTVAREDGGHGGEHGAEKGVLVALRRRRRHGGVGLGEQRRLGGGSWLVRHGSPAAGSG